MNEGVVRGRILLLSPTDLLRVVMIGQLCIRLGRLTLIFKQCCTIAMMVTLWYSFIMVME